MSTDYKVHAERLSAIIERLLVHLATPMTDQKLAELIEQALSAVETYHQDIGSTRIGLKTMVNLAIQAAEAEGGDVGGAVLRVIASRAKDCYQYIDEDSEMYQDVQNWLLCESRQEAIAL